MDMLPDWAAHLLSHHETLRAYTPYANTFYTYLSTLRAYALPLLTSATRQPDLATIALLLIILFISLKIFNMLWQTFLFWFSLARRVIFWGGLVGLGVWMYSRGPEGVQKDVGYWFEVWRSEKEHWVEKERMARMGQQARMTGGRGGRGGWF